MDDGNELVSWLAASRSLHHLPGCEHPVVTMRTRR